MNNDNIITENEADEFLASVLTADQYRAAMVSSEPVPSDEIDPEGWRYYSDVMTPETIEYQRTHPRSE